MSTLVRRLLTTLLVLIVLAAVVAGAGAYLAKRRLFDDRSRPAVATTVIIPRGSTLREAAEILERDGVARAADIRLLAKRYPDLAESAAGALVFPAHQSEYETLVQLHAGSHPAAIWVTIPEGFTAAEIGRRLRERGLAAGAGFEKYALHTPTTIDGERTASLEGYLFPSTYLLPIDVTPQSAAAIMVDEFRSKLPPDAKAAAKRLGYTIPQVVTVASLIEREAKADAERALMAGVYYNRLRIHMPLEVDATLEYAFASHHTVITASDLRVDSPYNSYRRGGLPPTPIANPGLPSLRAAFAPQRSRFLYYVYRGGGRHAFAATLQEHNANVARYLR